MPQRPESVPRVPFIYLPMKLSSLLLGLGTLTDLRARTGAPINALVRHAAERELFGMERPELG